MNISAEVPKQISIFLICLTLKIYELDLNELKYWALGMPDHVYFLITLPLVKCLEN